MTTYYHKLNQVATVLIMICWWGKINKSPCTWYAVIDLANHFGFHVLDSNDHQEQCAFK